MTFISAKLLALLGKGVDDQEVEEFLRLHRVHERPKTVSRLREEGILDPDDDTDVNYELEQISRESTMIYSEAYGLCLIFLPKDEYTLVYGRNPSITSDFVLQQFVLYAKGVIGSFAFPGELPGNVSFNESQQSNSYHALGNPIASRKIYDSQCDLFVMENRIVNFGFGENMLKHVHIRMAHQFDHQMLKNNIDPKPTFPEGAPCIGKPVSSSQVQSLLANLDIIEEDFDNGMCPEEITDLTISRGITLYFRDLPAGRHLSAISYKRRGDLISEGYVGELPFGFKFGDAPQTLVAKTGSEPAVRHESAQLMSYFWTTSGGHIVQAICSLIDWQLYRVTLHAAFLGQELGLLKGNAEQ